VATRPVPETLKFPAASRAMVTVSAAASVMFTFTPTEAHVAVANAGWAVNSTRKLAAKTRAMESRRTFVRTARRATERGRVVMTMHLETLRRVIQLLPR
jgi:hypothetical protein